MPHAVEKNANKCFIIPRLGGPAADRFPPPPAYSPKEGFPPGAAPITIAASSHTILVLMLLPSLLRSKPHPSGSEGLLLLTEVCSHKATP